MENFSPKNKTYSAGIIAIIVAVVLTMGFFVSRALACSCPPGETLTIFEYNSKPQYAFIDEGVENVVDQLCSTNYLSVDTTDGNLHYIYLTWDNLGDISGYENIAKFNLLLNHKENSTTIKVELKDELDNWIEVCDPAETGSFTLDTCDLSPYFDILKQVSPIELRIVAEKSGACHEYLKCAKLDVKLYHCEPSVPLTVNAYKVVCEAEEYLPNWGEGSGPSTIAETTASDYVTTSQGKCWLEQGWDFQWGFNGIAQKQSGEHIGPAPEGTGWNNFDSSTGSGSPAQVQISDLGGNSQIWVRENLIQGYVPFSYPPDPSPGSNISAEIYCYDDIGKYDNYDAVRNLQLGETYYCVAFNSPTGPYCGDGTCNGQETCETCESDCGPCPECQTDADCNDQSACTTDTCTDGECIYADVTCFDQDPCTDDSCNPQSGCVFTPNDKCVCDPNTELMKNGGFETPEVTALQLWDIFDSSFLGGWEVNWMSLSPSEWQGFPRPLSAYLELQRGVNGWSSKEGEQYAELDTDWDGPSGSLTNEPASVKIYQDISTIPGKNYDISFWFSPRPSTGLENNSLQFNWDGEVKDTISGAGENNTTWTEHKYSYPATGDTTRIEFADVGAPSDSLGTFLDKVSVRCNPNPPEPYCGDGNLDYGEQCEIGYEGQCAEGFTCNVQTCLCEEQPPAPYCGDGSVDQGEQCDNGTQNGQPCSPACESQCSYCSAICTLVTLSGGTCGRGGGGGGGGDSPPRPILNINKLVAEASITPGGILNFTIKVRNNGMTTAINVIVTDNLPAGFTYSDTGLTSHEWSVGNLAVGEEKVITYQVNVGSDVTAGDYQNIAVARADNHGNISAYTITPVILGVVLGEAVTRLPETGGNPLWISVIALMVAFGSAFTIRKLSFSRI